jgi:hypothetical protein
MTLCSLLFALLLPILGPADENGPLQHSRVTVENQTDKKLIVTVYLLPSKRDIFVVAPHSVEHTRNEGSSSYNYIGVQVMADRSGKVLQGLSITVARPTNVDFRVCVDWEVDHYSIDKCSSLRMRHNVNLHVR